MKTRLLILLIGLLSAGCLGRRTANDNTDNNVTAALPAADSAVAETAVAETAVAPVCDSIPEANPEARNFERHLCGQGDKTPRTNAQMHRKEDKYLKFWENPENNT